MPRRASAYFAVRVAPLDEDLIVVLADDQTAARRIEETRRDFVANVSHELKTPIGAISLLAEAVEDAAEDPDAVRRFAGRMGIESARLTDLVGQIIDLSRLQADNPLSDPEVVDIDAVLRDAVDRRRVDAEQRQVTLTVAGASGTKVLGSARQLGVAVGNLVENAVVYSDPGARVVVAAHSRRTATTTGSRSPSPTTASGSPRPSWSGSSNGSTGSTTPAAGPTAAPGSACRSSSTSPPSTAARCRCGASSDRARPSPSRSPPTCTTVTADQAQRTESSGSGD